MRSAVVTALVALCAISFAFSPASDAPYLEVVSTRMTCEDGGGSIGQWPIAPVHAPASQVAALYDPPGFVVVSENGLWAVSLPVTRNCTAPGMTGNNASNWLYPAVWTPLVGVTVAANTDYIITDAEITGSVAAVVVGGAAPGQVQFVTCSVGAGSCKVASAATAPFPFGVVHDAAVTVSDQGEVQTVWIACDAGLALFDAGKFQLLLRATDPSIGGPVTSVAASKTLPQVAAGNWMRLW